MFFLNVKNVAYTCTLQKPIILEKKSTNDQVKKAAKWEENDFMCTMSTAKEVWDVLHIQLLSEVPNDRINTFLMAKTNLCIIKKDNVGGISYTYLKY